MSLINDALKRASRVPPPAATPTASGMTPADHRPASPWPLRLVPVLLLAVAVVAAWFFWSAARMPRQPAGPSGPRQVAVRETAPPPEPGTAQPLVSALPHATAAAHQVARRLAGAEALLASTNLPGGAAPLPSPNSPTAGTAPPVTSPPSAAEPPKPATPPLKLKAIFYRPSNPSVLINSKTLFLGDRIGDARVIAIDQASATLVSKGQTNVLTIE